MTGVAYATGRHAWATCQKCGLRFKHTDMVLDGYWKNLVVCPDCWDDEHPQERLLRVSDPVGIRHGTPDTIYPPTDPVLMAPVLSVDDIEINWIASQSPDSGVAGYRVQRALGDGDYEQIADLTVTRDAFAAIESEPLSYSDTDLPAGTYSYRVCAYDMRDPPLESGFSNVVSETVPP